MYTEEQIIEYSNLASFITDLDMLKQLRTQNPELINEIEKFNAIGMILTSIEGLIDSEQEVSYLNVVQFFLGTMLNGMVDRPMVERKLSEYIPLLLKEGYVSLEDRQFKITDSGKLILQSRKEASLNAKRLEDSLMH